MAFNIDLLWFLPPEDLEKMKREVYRNNIVLVAGRDIQVVETSNYKPDYERIFEMKFLNTQTFFDNPNAPRYKFFSKDQEKKFLEEFEAYRIGRNVNKTDYIYLGDRNIKRNVGTSQFDRRDWNAITSLTTRGGEPSFNL